MKATRGNRYSHEVAHVRSSPEFPDVGHILFHERGFIVLAAMFHLVEEISFNPILIANKRARC